MRIKAVVIRIVKEILRDKRTLALILLAPIFLITLLNFIFTTNSEAIISLGVDKTVPTEVVKILEDEDVKVKQYSNTSDVKNVVIENDLSAFLSIDEENVNLTYKNEDPSNTKAVKVLVASSLSKAKIDNIYKLIKVSNKEINLNESYIYGSADSNFFDKIFPILIGFLVFFFVFLISGIALLRERSSGTLNRLLASPIKRSEIVIGYLIGYGMFAIIQTFLIVLYCINVLYLKIEGSIFLVFAINIMVALTALSIGIFVSTFANSEFQMVQFIPVVVIPQILFSGIIPLDTMADWIKNIGYVLPLSYAGKALSSVIVKGEGIDKIGIYLLALLGFVVVFTMLNILGLKKYRKV